MDIGTHYTKQGPYLLAYSLDRCCVCGLIVRAANSVKVRDVPKKILAKMTELPEAPEESAGYSETHHDVVCDGCV